MAVDPKALPKILYIDDTPEARVLVRRLLSREYIVLEAKDAIDGIELAMDTRPNLILLDINLPELSGREAATRLKSLLPGTPVVALTADTSPGVRERALAAGFTGFLTKPIDVDTFLDEVAAYLSGKHEILSDAGEYVQKYQEELVERLEAKVRELTKTAERNAYLNEQNEIIISMLQRRQRLLEGAARVGHSITSILNLDTLLSSTVDIICGEYGFDYAGIFLLDERNEWAVLKAGRGEAGEAMIAEGHCLEVGGPSMIGAAIRHRKARIALDVDQEQRHFKNPHLPNTRSEMALPLLAQDEVLGGLTVQSEQLNAFQDDDIAALQVLADQVAIAIQNARLLYDLETANQELLRTKTFEAIATATGEAIHWVGNKAAPILPSVERVREDLLDFIALCQALLTLPAETHPNHPFWEVFRASLDIARQRGVDLEARAVALSGLEPSQLLLLGGVESILEDLDIIQASADKILNIKEDLIGPVRLSHPEPVELAGFLEKIVYEMGLPVGVVQTQFSPDLSPVWGDTRQLANVFNNLIKNAWEALAGRAEPRIWLIAQQADEPGRVLIQVKDNGPGIPPEILDKIWVSFFTTKGDRGGTGLGLFSCMEIVHQAGGKIWVDSEAGAGATFSVLLPAAGEESF